MHPQTCYAGQISLCHAKIKKISEKIFVMINKDGGGDNFSILWGDTAVMRGDTELIGGPPTRENPEGCHGNELKGRKFHLPTANRFDAAYHTSYNILPILNRVKRREKPSQRRKAARSLGTNLCSWG